MPMIEFSFAEIVRQHRGLIGMIIQRWKAPPPGISVADLFEAGLIGLWDAYQTFDPTRGTKFTTHAMWRIRKWVLALVKEEGKRLRISALGEQDVGAEEEPMLDRLEEAEDLLRVREARKHLNNRQRQVMRLRYQGRMTWTDVAKRMKLSRPTVIAAHATAVERMRAWLNTEGV